MGGVGALARREPGFVPFLRLLDVKMGKDTDPKILVPSSDVQCPGLASNLARPPPHTPPAALGQE